MKADHLLSSQCARRRPARDYGCTKLREARLREAHASQHVLDGRLHICRFHFFLQSKRTRHSIDVSSLFACRLALENFYLASRLLAWIILLLLLLLLPHSFALPFIPIPPRLPHEAGEAINFLGPSPSSPCHLDVLPPLLWGIKTSPTAWCTLFARG